MIIFENISKNYSGQGLFNRVSFKINRKERVGLIGNNGHGKTTLFRLIIKEEIPDAGKITIPRNYRIGHVKQEVIITEKTVLLEAALGLREKDPKYFWKAEKILFGLGFSSQDMQTDPANLSGGFQVRLNLAKVLVSEPDMLLLDEPNNYLDITSIRWLSRFLSAWPGELILITHDRSFMDKVVTHTMGIHRKKTSKLSGNTEKFYLQTAKEEEIFEKTRINEARKKKEIELFISRFRSKARLAGMVQSRIKTISKMRNLEKLDQLKTLNLSFTNKPLGGKYVMSVKNVSFAYTLQHPLIKNFNLTVGAKDKICVIGQNGKGKTTLLKIISGNQKPDKGEMLNHPLATIGYYEQSNIKNLEDSRTVLEEIMIENKDGGQQKARNICGTMMFEQDLALKKIKILSGGEKSRVLIGKLLAKPVNLLLLDEPTNHLDMSSCNALVTALDNFEGAVIMVTHNEMLLHALAKRLIVFQDDRISIQENSYQDFLDKGGWGDEELPKIPSNKVKPAKTKLSKKQRRQRRSQSQQARNKVLKPTERQISEIEKTIELHESELKTLNADLIKASKSQDSALIAELSKSVHGRQKTIDSLFNKLESITNKLDKMKLDLG